MSQAYIEESGQIVDFIERAKNAGVRPALRITGGTFSGRNMWMGSTCVMTSSGLHEVTYWVVEKTTGLVISKGASKAEALQVAREALKSIKAETMDRLLLCIAQEIQRRERAAQEQHDEKRAAVEKPTAEKRIPRRRQRIYEKSGGKCYYCGCDIDLKGAWHIEHKMPKSMGGSNAPGNLVASCVRCNLRKSDQTSQEFISGIRAVEGA